jgi:hypothetical protein
MGEAIGAVKANINLRKLMLDHCKSTLHLFVERSYLLKNSFKS